MKHAYLFFTFLLVLVWPFNVYDAKAQNIPKTEPNTLVYKLKPSAPSSSSRTAVTSPLQQVVQRIATSPAVQKFPQVASLAGQRIAKKNAADLSLIYQLNYNPSLTFAQVKKQLLSTGLVEYVEPLYRYEPLHMPNDPRADSVTGAQQAYLKKIQAYKAWDITTGDSTVVIGILDTGVRLTHEDLKGNIKYNNADPIDGIDNDKDGYIDNFQGWDMADDDNDPTADVNGHGTSVAGIAAGQANNGIGIAGVGYNCKFLPIKIYSSKSDGPFKGYEAIVYAADRGVKVINLSWGAASFWSAYEQDVINYAAINKDVVIVAAAGNTNDHLDFYPASYDNVLSVSALDKDDIKGENNTFSYKIDIGALGVATYSTGSANDKHYANSYGSSMATPIVAGAAALLRSHFPTLTALQIAERLRVTADDIYNLPGNAAYLEKLGKGRVNVYKALSETAPTSVRLTDWNLGGAKLGQGETVQIFGTFLNFLRPVANLSVTISTNSQYVEITQGNFAAGSMATMQTKTNQTTPFKFKIAANTPPNTSVTFRLSFTDGSYTDYQHVQLVLNPSFITTDVNDLAVSVMSNGNLGYNGLDYSQGLGVTYQGSAPLLAEGALLIGYSETEVSDNVRNEKGSTDRDFYATSSLLRLYNSPHADFHASNYYEDSLTATKTKSLSIQQSIFGWKDNSNRGFVLLEYVLTNRSAQPINNAYAGIFADWDLQAAGSNVAQWNNQLKLGIVRHVSDTSIWAGVQIVSDGAPGFYALENSSTGQPDINLGDGFSSKEKYLAMSGGVKKEQAGGESGNDVSFMISSPIKSLAPEARDTVGFALVAGSSRTEILQNAAAALQKYEQLTIARTVTSSPVALPAGSVTLLPNPTQGQIEVTLPTSLQQTAVTVQVINSQGQVLSQGVYQRKASLHLDLGHLPSGLYFLKIISEAGTITKKTILSK